jgi:hypothetical protein
MRGERMVIRNEKIAGMRFLQTHEIAQGAKIIAQMQASRRTDTAQYSILLLTHGLIFQF